MKKQQTNNVIYDKSEKIIVNVNVKFPERYINAGGYTVPVRKYGALVVGSGAAGYGCAFALAESGINVPDVCIITEGRKMGTSRNTGSDKQTYYKLASSDSAVSMAKDMMAAGSMHGDIAYVEAVNSLRGFHRLTAIGVPFPHNEYGEYVGYRTDHDTAGRATSCGPLTSKFMTEALEREIDAKKIPYYDGYRVVSVITENGSAKGILAVSDSEITDDNKYGFAVFETANIVLAVGGPSAIYATTVYPESQTCALGLAFAAGALGANLTESQYGLASVSPRWNVSGSYQQVIPRYISTDENGGDVKEFLSDYIKNPEELLSAIFKKGYEWPFSPNKVKYSESYGSSAVDLAVFTETSKGRKVYLDFLHNPKELMCDGKVDLSLAGEEAHQYLINCGCEGELPIERLEEMNRPAIDLYASFGVDITKEPLQIAVCAQHCNGGVGVDKWYESTVSGLFVIGEAAGVFGVQRPGGSALNSTQVGSIRAAEKIADNLKKKQNIDDINEADIASVISLGEGSEVLDLSTVLSLRRSYAEAMTGSCSFLRRPEKIKALIEKVKREIAGFKRYGAADFRAKKELYINYDILITQLAMLTSADAYVNDGGLSRGSYLITDETSDEILRGKEPKIDTEHKGKVGYVKLVRNEIGSFDHETYFEPVRPLPEGEYWFEKVYNEYRVGGIFEK